MSDAEEQIDVRGGRGGRTFVRTRKVWRIDSRLASASRWTLHRRTENQM